jgi:hypothetical protein
MDISPIPQAQTIPPTGPTTTTATTRHGTPIRTCAPLAGATTAATAPAVNMRLGEKLMDGISMVDATDLSIATERLQARTRLPDIQAGDVLLMGEAAHRVAHDWGDTVQWCDKRAGSFYLTSSGHASMSGGLEPGIPKEHISHVPDRTMASFWIFHHGRSGAHRGVHFKGETRTWRYVPPEGTSFPESFMDRDDKRRAGWDR